MKTLYMKPIYLLMVLTMMMGFTFTACSSDDPEGSTTVEFPALKELSGNAGETLELSFSAGTDWTLSSNKGWCKFKDGEFTETTLSGKAGSQTVQIVISESQLTSEVAELTLTMVGKSQVICKVTCQEKQYADLVVTDEEGNVYDAEHPLVIKGSGLTDNAYDIVYTTIKVESEKTVGIPEKPNWIKAQASTETPGVFLLTFDKESGISAINSFNNADDKLVIATEDKKQQIEIPVSYEGLREDVITFKETDLSFTKNHMTLDHNSTYFSVSNSMTGEETTYSLPLTLTVDQVRNGEFGYIIGRVNREETYPNYYSYTYDFDATGLDSWVKVSINDKNVSLDVDKLTEDTERGAIVLLISKDFCDKYKGHYNDMLLDEEGYFSSTYQDNVMVSFTQVPEKKVTSLQLKGYVMMNGTLTPFEKVPDDAAMISDSSNPMFDYANDDKMSQNFWYVSANKSLLQNGNKIYLEVVGDIPSGYSIGAFNAIGWPNTHTSSDTIDGKTYIVISGAPTDKEIANQPVITVGVGNFDMGDFLIECGITVW